MTASPTPPDFFAESANKSATPIDAQVGLPSEEGLARVIMCARDNGGCEVNDWAMEERDNPHVGQALRQARAILALVRPAFEAKERETRKAIREVVKWSRAAGEAEGRLEMSEAAGIVEGWRSRALSAEAKLAQAVEALNDVLAANQRFRDQMPANWEADPLQDACDRAAAAMGEKK